MFSSSAVQQMKPIRLLFFLIFLAVLGAACARLPWVGEKAPRPGDRYYGVASWYGHEFHGRSTANGERFNMNALTAAHRTFPFGTRVRVTNLRNGRKCVVRINDRGPWIRGREIDLSYAAARDLGMLNTGLEKVLIEVLSVN
ncbi:MAG: septal ring lytic transglycosylase RlpA family protein [Candidatus Abyssobacteria bacterium SURF_5]|uniref:Probable endolytic peptidoglycan transglycosylase RlpA n=1 Tax=Abyssobacteria bacterium (strain SURF_5) TaxID=2093360 RepID=A0A3A4NUJ6_ABYX5|nr:MAG: septal ring lytic transglycosylase RlpA family protein [Candidatus Abyssubacteria bacterium SURF_5]